MALILIADSSAPERQRLRHIIEADDHVVVEADSGAYCLEIAEYHQPQCVLLNYLLANTDNFELLQTLKQLKISTIVLTDTSQPDIAQQYLKFGALKVLNSPPERSEILQVVASTVNLSPVTQPPIAPKPDVAAPQPAQSRASTDQSPSPDKPKQLQHLLSIDKLQHFVGLGIEQAAVTLNQLTACPISFQPPVVETMTAQSLQSLLQQHFGKEPVCAAQLPFSGGLSGAAQLFFPKASGITFTTALTGEDPSDDDFKMLQEEALTEAGNIVLNSILGTISNTLTERLTFDVPSYREDLIENLTPSLAQNLKAAILLAKTSFTIDSLQVSGDIILFFNMRLFFDLAANPSD